MITPQKNIVNLSSFDEKHFELKLTLRCTIA